jgi:hypothetical protein
MECQWARPAYRRSEKLYTKPTSRYHANIGNTSPQEVILKSQTTQSMTLNTPMALHMEELQYSSKTALNITSMGTTT